MAFTRDPIQLHRKSAKSKRIDYLEPVILFENNRRRIEMFAVFPPGSNKMKIRIETFKKTKETQLEFIPVEEKSSIWLDDKAIESLLRGLQGYLGLSKASAGGKYLLVPLVDDEGDLSGTNPSDIGIALGKLLQHKSLAEHIAKTEITEDVLSALKSAVRLKEMRTAITQLREYLTTDVNDEQTYQEWCEKHTWAFGNAYVIRDDVREISPGDTLDLLLPSAISGFRDLIELKRPDKSVIRWDDRHRNFYFSSEVSQAIGQCHRYMDVLHEEAATGLRDHPEIFAYHPRATIVIGRSDGWEEKQFRGLHGLNCRLSGISVITYDQLLAQGVRLLEMLEESEQLEGAGF
jgi:Domain of unknown function (DUF4263)